MRHNHKLTIQRHSGTTDALGSQDGQWSDVGTVWASVMPLGTRSFLAAKAEQADITHDVRMPFDARIQAGDRLLWGDDQPITLMVRGVAFATGEVVVVDDRFAVRIKTLIAPKGGGKPGA